MVDHQQPCPRHLTCVWLNTIKAAPVRPTPWPPLVVNTVANRYQRGHKYIFSFTVAYQLTNSSLLQIHLVLVLWENTYSHAYPSLGGYVELYAVWVHRTTAYPYFRVPWSAEPSLSFQLVRLGDLKAASHTWAHLPRVACVLLSRPGPQKRLPLDVLYHHHSGDVSMHWGNKEI